MSNDGVICFYVLRRAEIFLKSTKGWRLSPKTSAQDYIERCKKLKTEDKNKMLVVNSKMGKRLY